MVVAVVDFLREKGSTYTSVGSSSGSCKARDFQIFDDEDDVDHDDGQAVVLSPPK